MPTVAFKHNPNRLGRLTSHSVRKWMPSLAIWGICAGVAGTYLLSDTPVVKKQLLNIPIVKNYYEDKVPPEDKPF